VFATGFLAGCCPVGGAPGLFERERLAVEAETGADLESVPVFVVPDVRERCEGYLGCCDDCGIVAPAAPVLSVSSVCPLLTDNPGCWTTPEEVAAHEFVHAAIGHPEHGPEFWAVLGRVQKLLE
jgi:hypothetical protein